MLAGTVLLVPTTDVVAQPESSGDEEIETDRDSFTPSPSTAPAGLFILESAYSFIDNRSVADTHSYPELVTRYGVNDWLELRLGWNYEVGGESAAVSGSSSGSGEFESAEIEREGQVSYGFKAALTEQDEWIPESAFIVQAGTPTSGKETATQLISTYVIGWEFENKWKWDSSIRYGYDTAEGDHFNLWAPSTVLKVPVCEKWTAHAEYFGIFTDGSENDTLKHYFSPGLHYLVTNDLEIGFRVGWGLNQDAANFFSNVGLGWQF